VRNCEKDGALFAPAFSNRGENHQGNAAEGHLARFSWRCQFPQASPSSAFFLFATFSFFVKIVNSVPGKWRSRIAYRRRSAFGACITLAGFSSLRVFHAVAK
jgi:hypothetical protein